MAELLRLMVSQPRLPHPGQVAFLIGAVRAVLPTLLAFVKVAQAMSSQPDVIPPAYLEKLSLLQDRITPFYTEASFNLI
ncbi:hypothetical protein DsansV1_C08g0084891 [Dioscorea sansibarensis]